MEENIVFNTEDVKNNKAMGILAYIGILFLVPLFAAKDSQYARFHTNQGLVLFIADIILYIATGIITTILGFAIPLIGIILGGLLYVAVSICVLIFLIIGIMNACSGEAKKLPLIGNITIFK